MSKEKVTDNPSCIACDSTFRITYIADECNGNHRFCPFCASELDFGDIDDTFDQE